MQRKAENADFAAVSALAFMFFFLLSDGVGLFTLRVSA